jgi:MarR family transcriptional regulator, organic hydroperoxide resistance regulator
MDNLIFDSFSFLLVRVVRAHRSLIRSQVHELGLHRGQPLVLFALEEKDGMSNSELAECLEITPATLTNKIKRMEKANFVIRRRDPDDERVNRIFLSDKGRALMEDLRRSTFEMESVLLAGFSKSDVDRLKKNLKQVLKNIEEHERSLG